MAGLSVIFKAIDEISDKLDAMSSAGNKTLDAFDKLSDTADKAFANTTEETQKATEAMEKAAQATDYWTDAVGNYDKGCLEAVYSTEELVNMGFKTEDALKAEADAAEEAQNKTEQLGEEMDKTSKKSEDFGDKSKNAVVGLDDILATVGIVAVLNKIADAFSDASDKATEFETNVAMVSTVADTTVLSADQLSTQISGLSKDTAKNVNELADATYNAISAGVATEGAVETVGEASKLATAGFTSSASALSVLTTALNAYQLEASEVTNISDSLITSQNLGVMTIDQLSSSMGKAISTASAYSIDLYNLESGYISLTKAGVSVEESTTYISSMFNELGDSGSEVAGVIMEETGQSFGQLMKSGYSLADVLEILYNSVDQDSEALMNLWGSAEAGKAANAVINQGLDTFNNNLDKLRNSAGTTERAYSAMTNTTQYATERMQNSFNNLAIAIGDDINPTVAQFKNGIADITDGFTELITKHPAISALLTGAAVGIGGVTLALTAYTAVTKVATVVTAAMGTTMSVALGPLALVAAAIGGVTAAVIYLNNTEDEMAKAQENLTLSSKETQKELDKLQDQYAELEEAGQADTVAAYELKNQIDELSASFEENKETMGSETMEGQLAAKILDEYMKGFQERNPTLRVFAAHLHLDEATPHLHIDFIPYVTGSKRGLDTRVSLKQALSSLGFKGGSRSETELNQWVQSEKEKLAMVMRENEIEWDQKGTHEPHLSVLDYKKKVREQEVEELTEHKNLLEHDLHDISECVDEIQKEKEQAEKERDAVIKKTEVLEKRFSALNSKAGLVDSHAREYGYYPEEWLPEAGTLESAKSYRKRIFPLLKKVTNMIQSLYSKYLELKDRNRKLSDRNMDLENRVERLREEVSVIKKENVALLNVAYDMDRVVAVLGENKVKEAIEVAKHLEQTNAKRKIKKRCIDRDCR